MKNRVEYCNILFIICQENEWNNWLCVSSCTGNWHRQTTCPPVCAYQYVYTDHTSSTVCTVKRFKMLRAKMLHPVYSRPYRCLDFICIFFYSFITLYYSDLVFLLPYWIFFKSQYFSTFCDWRSLLLIHIQHKSYRNCLDNLYRGVSDITWRYAIILNNLHLSAHL